MAYACKTSSARKIVGVIPYLPYCKQSKMRKRGCIVSKLVATLLGNTGMAYRFRGRIIFPAFFHIGLRPIKHN